MEQTLLDTNRPPETPDDFDRLLVSHPNSSTIWVQYMAYHLHTAEVDKARAVAERALKTISFRYLLFGLAVRQTAKLERVGFIGTGWGGGGGSKGGGRGLNLILYCVLMIHRSSLKKRMRFKPLYYFGPPHLNNSRGGG